MRDTARDALRAVRALEELDSDIFGQYVIAPGEQLDGEDFNEFIELAQSLYPEQELAVVVIARSPRKDQGDENGTEQAGKDQV